MGQITVHKALRLKFILKIQLNNIHREKSWELNVSGFRKVIFQIWNDNTAI